MAVLSLHAFRYSRLTHHAGFGKHALVPSVYQAEHHVVAAALLSSHFALFDKKRAVAVSIELLYLYHL